MMRLAGVLLLAAALSFCMPAWAQKWVDEKGRVYYGDKPPGVKVKPAEMKGGGTGSYSTEDISKRLQQRADAKSTAINRHGRAGKAVEYRPDMPRGGPANRASLR